MGENQNHGRGTYLKQAEKILIYCKWQEAGRTVNRYEGRESIVPLLMVFIFFLENWR